MGADLKLIVLSPFVYYPGVPNGGGALCWGQLAELAHDNELHFLSFVTPGGEDLAVAKPHLSTVCKTVTTVVQRLGRVDVLRSKLRLLTKLVPVVASLCQSDEMRAKLLALIARVQPDAVFIQFPQMAQYVALCAGTPTLMDVQDAFSVSSYRLYKVERGWAKRSFALLTWLAWIKYESQWYPQFSVTTALTQQDAAGLEIFTPGVAATVSKAAVSVPPEGWMPTAQNTIAFIGSYAHLPNVDAVLFFVRQVLPLVLTELPDAVFLVAGKGATPEMQTLASKNVQFVGTVPSSHAFLASAAVVVIPLRSGGGIKIKTLEALATGCPLVSTSIGAEETGAIPGIHLLIADSPVIFARQVIALLKDSAAARQLGANARSLVSAHFSWQAKRLSLTKQIEMAIASHHSNC